MLNRILIPLDGSESAEKAIVQAGPLLRRPGTETILVRVIDTMAVDPLLRPKAAPEMRTEASRYLSDVADRMTREGIRVSGSIREGLAAEEILEASARARATLIALTSHGRTGLSRLMLGSVAETVLRSTPVPVLVLPSFAGGTPAAASEVRLGKLLVPIDETELSLNALAPAATLALAFGASIVLVHVESSLDFPEGTYVSKLVDRSEEPPSRTVPAEPAKRLEHAAQVLAHRGLTVVTLRVGGDAPSRISGVAKDLGADAVVLATHGRSGLSRILFGSVAEQVLRQSGLPTLIVPPATAE